MRKEDVEYAKSKSRDFKEYNYSGDTIEEDFANFEEIAEATEKIIKNKKEMNCLNIYAKKWIYLRTNGNSTINAMTAADIVNESFTRVLEMGRKWNKKKCEKFFVFIQGVILSIIKNEADKIRRQKTEIIKLYPDESESANSLFDILQCQNSDKNFEESKIQEAKELREMVVNLLKDDEIAYFVFEEREKGFNNTETANNLKLTVKEVENALKRIKRKLLNYKEI